MRQHATELARRIRAEDGLSRTTELFSQHIAARGGHAGRPITLPASPPCRGFSSGVSHQGRNGVAPQATAT